MSEIKYDSSTLSNYIDAIEQHCNQLETRDYTARDASAGMPSCTAFIEEHQSIAVLLKLYKDLVIHEICDLREMYLSVEELDEEISDSFDLNSNKKK